MNITLKRGITGIFIIAVILAPILLTRLSPFIFIYILASLCCLTLMEYFDLLSVSNKGKPQDTMGSITGIALFLISSFIVFVKLPCVFLLLLIPLFLTVFGIELYRRTAEPITNLAQTILGIIWIALPFGLYNFYFLPGLYSGDRHIPALALFVFLWVNDTGAYLTGIAFGKRKLFERISPGKTWEGSAGGILFTLITAFVVSFFWKGYTWQSWVVFGVITAIAGTFGDLFESLFKRNLGCKDSGNMIPGHGGFLDRFDSFLFAAPAVFVFMILKYLLNI
ncbi:MAG: Phosphatidate cytidylyltransferase [Bacteroidetes bacterium ADurb.Bin408]|nr:MAG: Phosphatidate cytidylyltransferase [Bacteroidetes bacterium ADurb.Bin408]